MKDVKAAQDKIIILRIIRRHLRLLRRRFTPAKHHPPHDATIPLLLPTKTSRRITSGTHHTSSVSTHVQDAKHVTLFDNKNRKQYRPTQAIKYANRVSSKKRTQITVGRPMFSDITGGKGMEVSEGIPNKN